ncbi:MAG: tryptophan synthase subunit alpha [Bacteroidota bacterium]
MTSIKNYIEEKNKLGRKVLTIFLTAGYPDPKTFVNLACSFVEAGADILEIGLPFADSLADGLVIQSSYLKAIENNISPAIMFELTKEIRAKADVPIILMSAANPVLRFGLDNFINTSITSGINGLIIPDIPLEEHAEFYNSHEGIDKILLTTPTSSDKRIIKIDQMSSGFVYCVSVAGTTGVRNKFTNETLDNLKRTYGLVTKNKMLIGFGISTPEDIINFKPYCDGVIVGSSVVKRLAENLEYKNAIEFVRSLSDACNFD